MYDAHYDLLTHILLKKENINELKDYFGKVYRKDNIIGGIFNLFYMSEEEMKEEVGQDKKEINVVENLKEVKNIIEKNNLIPENTDYIFGVEGLDYLKNINDIDTLYSMGLRSTNPVWNHNNKFGGGADTNKKLTEKGKTLIKKLVEKNIAIDLSHSNIETFFDIINHCKKLKEDGYNPIVFASHSNARSLCDVDRNLTDEQILAIKDLCGVVGLVSIKRFCIDEEEKNEEIDFEQHYINHFKYVKKLLGNVDNICVSTDDLKYNVVKKDYFHNANIYKQSEVKTKLEKALLNNGFTNDEIEKMFITNFKEKILNKL